MSEIPILQPGDAALLVAKTRPVFVRDEFETRLRGVFHTNQVWFDLAYDDLGPDTPAVIAVFRKPPPAGGSAKAEPPVERCGDCDHLTADHGSAGCMYEMRNSKTNAYCPCDTAGMRTDAATSDDAG